MTMDDARIEHLQNQVTASSLDRLSRLTYRDGIDSGSVR